jgi:hypothetical protein
MASGCAYLCLQTEGVNHAHAIVSIRLRTAFPQSFFACWVAARKQGLPHPAQRPAKRLARVPFAGAWSAPDRAFSLRGMKVLDPANSQLGKAAQGTCPHSSSDRSGVEQLGYSGHVARLRVDGSSSLSVD